MITNRLTVAIDPPCYRGESSPVVLNWRKHRYINLAPSEKDARVGFIFFLPVVRQAPFAIVCIACRTFLFVLCADKPFRCAAHISRACCREISLTRRIHSVSRSRHMGSREGLLRSRASHHSHPVRVNSWNAAANCARQKNGGSASPLRGKILQSIPS